MQLVAYGAQSFPGCYVLASYEAFESRNFNFWDFSEVSEKLSYVDCFKIYKKIVEQGEFNECIDDDDFYEIILPRAYYLIRMARRIRNAWTHIYYSPETDIGRRRLEREIEGLINEGVLST